MNDAAKKTCLDIRNNLGFYEIKAVYQWLGTHLYSQGFDVEAHIVISGSPVDGLTFHGPFNEVEEAIRFSESLAGEDWWMTKLELP